MSEFRKAVEPVAVTEPKAEPKTEVVDTRSPVETKAPELLATYSEDQGKPYVAQYLGIENVWDQDATMRNEVETIEGYIKDQISKGKLDNSVKAGDKFIRQMEKDALVNPYESATNKISKLLAYIEFKRVVES